jgi:prepilin-type N-terminal cleavage/methylation domain-containing protein
MFNKRNQVDFIASSEDIQLGRQTQIKGFTLIEVMIAMFLLLFGTLAYFQLQLSAIRLNEVSKQLMIAQDAASQEIEMVKTVGYTGIRTSSTLINDDFKYSTFNELDAKYRLAGIDTSCNAPASYCVYKGLTVRKTHNGNRVDYLYTLKLSVNPSYLTYPALAEVDAVIYWKAGGDLKNISIAAFVGL